MPQTSKKRKNHFLRNYNIEPLRQVIFYYFIYLIDNKVIREKRRASDRFTCLPICAPEAGLEPATL